MPFDPSTILDVWAAPRGADLAVSWASSAPAGSVFQVYVDRKLAWHGAARSAVLPHPSGPVRIEVGTVAAGKATRSFAASLPTPPGGGSRAWLTWLGGRYLGRTILGFHVYGGTAPGGAVDYSSAVARVAAYPQGIILDGWGVGGWGQGGWGMSAGTYSWTSGPLISGTWNFAVKPFDAAGNEGAALTWAIVISGPPRPVARNAAGRRLTYTTRRVTPAGWGEGAWGQGGWGAGTPLGWGQGGWGAGPWGRGATEGGLVVSLSWLASPGA